MQTYTELAAGAGRNMPEQDEIGELRILFEPERYSVVPDNYEVGYVIRGNNALLVAREDKSCVC